MNNSITSIIFVLLLFFSLQNNSVSSQNHVMSFDGADDYVNLGASVAAGVRTIEMRFKPAENLSSANVTTPRTLIGRNHLLINTFEFNLSIRSDGKLWFNINSQGASSPGGTIKSDTTFWQKDHWYYVAAVIHPTNGMALYIDGAKQSQIVAAETNAIDTLQYITTLGCWGDEYVRNFGGLMDEVRLWTRALDANEITQNPCEISNPNSASGLKAYYKMNEGSGLVVFDSSANSFHGSNSGAIWIVDSSCTGVTSFPIGIETNSESNKYTLSPNPANSVLKLSIDNPITEIQSVTIYSASGRLLKTLTLNSKNVLNINVSDLASGYYLISITDQNQQLHNKTFVIGR